MKITLKKLHWFTEMQEAIEERATFCLDYIHRKKIPSVSNERLSSIEAYGTEKYPAKTVVYKYICGENNYITIPTKLLYDNEALVKYRNEKEAGEKREIVQQKENKEDEELRMLKRLAEKYPQFFKDGTLKEELKEPIKG